MRKLTPISTEYIRSSRSIEILLLVKGDWKQTIFIYNYEGLYFHYFESLVKIIQYFEKGIEPNRSFFSEQDLDDFLETL